MDSNVPSQLLTRPTVERWCDQNGFTLVPRKAALPFAGMLDDPQGALEPIALPVVRSGRSTYEMTSGALVIDAAWISRFAEWNLRTFGPGMRTAGTVDHIRKECCEIEANPTDPKEWVDIILLGINGLVRQGRSPLEIISEIHGKHEINENRDWPDWRSTDPLKAIEHDRTAEVSP